jgi:glycosyltransferase involved in cell wall biosynthesis
MLKNKTVVCFGAGPAFKGGMADYNTSLAKTFSKIEGVKTHIVSWSQQYPSIVPREFKDKVSRLDFLEGTDISCNYITNYNNPLSWYETAKYIASLNPDIVVIQWSIAIQGLPISLIVKKLKKISSCEVIIDLHFVIQKEQSSIDKLFTKMGLAQADSYIVHANKTFEELKEVFPKRQFLLTPTGKRDVKSKTGVTPVIKLFHPIYDIYKPDPAFDVQAFKEKYGLKKNVFLFFGFIRKYKGLHNAIKAFELVAKKRDDVSFLICGELFWNTLESNSIVTKIKKGLFYVAKKIFLGAKEDEKEYNPLTLIEELNLKSSTVVFSEFVPNEDVHKYFQVADAVVLYYLTATPSGIESLSYNFNLPILATDVGHFPETIKEGENGYLAKADDVNSMAETMLKMLNNPIPRENVGRFKSTLSWEAYAKAILNSL